MTDWLILVATLPTSPSGLRVRIWRALKVTACASLRDGVYILPAQASSAAALWAIQSAIREGGAEAHMLQLQACDATQEAGFRALFDRSQDWAEFAQSLKDRRQTLRQSSEAELRKQLHGLDQQWQALQRSDFFPGPASQRAAEGMRMLRAEIDRKLSPGEPQAAGGGIDRLARDDFQGRTWATRQRPWVDRLATAWLITRFIDNTPRFLWLKDARRCPKSALGFDFDGARFSHVGDQVSFEVVIEAFGLQADAALKRLAELVHYVDVGGIPVEEAAGLQTMARGLLAQHADDDALLAATLPVFDALYAAWRSTP